ncbi:MAG TPA: amidase [Ilumatobacteraceae bacterium]|nr:amidase [Ilumatobacteraceae bacterium]
MSELWQMGALELAGLIREGGVSSREVVEAHLVRVDKVNAHLNAIVRLLADEALAAADAADRAVAEGCDLGPLHGVPCTVKENIDVAGTPTTQGVGALAHAVAAVDAPTVARMRAAGAIPFARTNLPDLGLRIHTHSSLHGLTSNPWNPHVTAGGSSGGEAAALASGMSPIGLGNDIGGSLRNPAHCCGIAAIKPSAGVVPMATVIPPEDMMLAQQQMLVEGPMARHVADVRAGLGIVAGPDVRDPRSLPVQLTDAEPGERLRVAVLADPPGGTTDTGISSTVRRVADILSDAGHDVVEAVPPDYEDVLQLWAMSLIIDLRAQRPLLDAVVGDDGRAVLANFDLTVPALGVDEILGFQVQRFRAMRMWSAFFADHPIMLSPTWAHPAFAHGHDIDASATGAMLDTLRPVLAANILGLPAAVVPGGVADGLPVGIQVMGDRYTDLRCLTVAAEIEAAVGRLTPIDPVTT